MVEYLDPEIANEGFSVDKHNPGAWMDEVPTDDEWQPDMEPAHINDYAAFKKNKWYGQYFNGRNQRKKIPFPALMHHAVHESRLCQNKEQALALGPEWGPEPHKPRVDMTGKSIPVKSETQRLAEVIAATKNGGDSSSALFLELLHKQAAEHQAQMAKMEQRMTAVISAAEGASPVSREASVEATIDDNVERDALLELAEKEGVKVDGRWSSARIKKELGLG